MTRLTLSQAIAEGKLQDFASQDEADGVGPADCAQFEAIVGGVTAPEPEGHTSRSPVRGSKHGK
jgi:hypothetical protein